MPPALDIDHLNEIFRAKEPWEILIWAEQTFAQKIAATSSFQTQSLPLLHMIAKHTPNLPILFLNTGFHFPETLAYRDQLVAELGLTIESLTPQMGHQAFLQRHGQLYSNDPDMCCYINKVEPLARERESLDAWITGIRRDQTPERSNTQVLTLQSDNKYKIAPLAFWTQQDVDNYITIYELPEHPLRQFGYRSIGCEPCTHAVAEDADYREGRWAESAKRECGLHENYFNQVNKSVKKKDES